MRSRASISSHPIHPMLVAFPLALWIMSLAFDLSGKMLDAPALWSAGWYTALAGAIGAVLAAIPGVIDLLSVVPPNSSAKQRGWIHGSVNVVVLLIFIFGVLAHRDDATVAPDSYSLLASIIGVGLLAFSGWLGGTLVFRNQIGVDHRYAGAGQWREIELKSWRDPVINEAELAEGQMIVVHKDGKRIVVGRCGDGFAAFSDHCTHSGGPLGDGALVGCTVQCPWHGSQFNVHTGRVVAGPAQQRIEVFDVQIRAGEIYISPVPEMPARAA